MVYVKVDGIPPPDCFGPLRRSVTDPAAVTDLDTVVNTRIPVALTFIDFAPGIEKVPVPFTAPMSPKVPVPGIETVTPA
jgi:hypothetical protein